MISAYGRFEICWLDKDEGLQEKQILRVSKQLYLPLEPTKEEKKKKKNDEDEDYAGENYRQSHVAIVNALVDSLTSPRVIKDNVEGYYECFSPNFLYWKHLSLPKLHSRIPSNVEELYILKYFFPSSEGNVYHVCDSSGGQGVVKFHHDRRDAEALCKIEQDRWLQINKISISTITLNGRPVLLMPYLTPVTREDKDSFKAKTSFYEQVVALLKTVVELGLYQHNARWRHIGWYHNNGVSEVKLFDFGHLASYGATGFSSADEALADMLKSLFDTCDKFQHR